MKGKKLVLNRETVRDLTPKETGQVAGGVVTTTTTQQTCIVGYCITTITKDLTRDVHETVPQ